MMEPFSQWERLGALERMGRNGVEVLVIGGGITGVSVAMDAAARGYRVGLVEKSDFASGTSSKSTGLVHGGLRYLPQFDFRLVREALVERGLLFQNAPWIVSPLGFVLPLYAWNRRPLGTPISPPFGLGLIVRSGLLLYDLLAGRLNVRRHRRLTLGEARNRAPALSGSGLTRAFMYYDGQTDDARLTLAVLRTAVGRGALAANYAQVTGFDISDGRITAAHVQDTMTGHNHRIGCRHVINAGGVFAQRIEELTGLPAQLSVEPAKGVHLVFSRDTIPMSEDAIVLPETDDGRLLFVIPRGGRVVIGTTDTSGGDIDNPTTTEEDTGYLLRHCNRYLNVALTPEDIIGAYAGFRPLVRNAGTKRASTARLSRSHVVQDGPAGMISIVGGKLTTWRRMAEDTMNFVARREGRRLSNVTRSIALVGTAEWPLAQQILSANSLELAADVRTHLGAAYGANLRRVLAVSEEEKGFARRIVPGLPYLMAEVAYACRHEMALTLDDVLSRRLKLAVEDRQQGMSVALEVAEVMAAELGWDDAEVARQVAAYQMIARDQYPVGG